MSGTAQFSYDDLQYLAPEERAELEELILDRERPVSLRGFIEEHFPHEPPPPHLDALIDIIERARHERIKVCISWPPRHAKTVTILRAIIWWLTHEPADSCAYYSYSDKQAWSKSRLCRNWAKRSGIRMSGDMSNVGEWHTENGGCVYAGGLLSGLTGKGVSGLFIVDDPFKNREEADSAVTREKIWDAFNEVVFTRLEGASVIVVHTRWHEDDLIGRLKEQGDWEVVNFPALAEEGEEDRLGRAPGEALWPEKFSAEELEAIRGQIGDWSFAALYQGRPTPRGANVFGEPARFDLPQTPEQWQAFLHGKYLVLGADPAASAKTRADYSAVVLLARDALGPVACQGWVLDVARNQEEIPSFVRRLRAMQAKWRCLVAVEAVGGFKAVPQMLHDVDPSLRILEVTPTTDKFTRAQPVSAAWNDGRVYVPTRESWVDPLLKEVLSFTGVKDPNDDQVDALSHAWNALAKAAPPRRRGARRSEGAFG